MDRERLKYTLLEQFKLEDAAIHHLMYRNHPNQNKNLSHYADEMSFYDNDYGLSFSVQTHYGINGKPWFQVIFDESDLSPENKKLKCQLWTEAKHYGFHHEVVYLNGDYLCFGARLTSVRCVDYHYSLKEFPLQDVVRFNLVDMTFEKPDEVDVCVRRWNERRTANAGYYLDYRPKYDVEANIKAHVAKCGLGEEAEKIMMLTALNPQLQFLEISWMSAICQMVRDAANQYHEKQNSFM